MNRREARKTQRRSRTQKQSSVLLGIVGMLGAKIVTEINSTLERRKLRQQASLPINEKLTLRQIRERRALSQADLAETMSVTPLQISDIEDRPDMYVS